MVVCLVARDEPYASYRPEQDGERDSDGSLSFFSGGRDEPELYRDVTVLPVQDFLGLTETRRLGSIHIAYGPVSLIDEAFAGGCADYLREPWSLLELRARLRPYAEPRFEIGDCRFSLRGSELCRAGASIPLTDHERRILRPLARRCGETIHRSILCRALGSEGTGGGRSLDVHIGRLRKKLSTLSPGAGKAICAVRGVGYRLLCRSCG